jgi:hypothetical protein
VTEDALALAFRTGLPYVGLRDHAHDPDLDRLIPPDAARRARATPLAADDDRVRLAVADPNTDLSTLDPYLAGRQVELAVSPREELDTILGPPPPAEPEQSAPEERPEPAEEELAAEAAPVVEPEAAPAAEPEPEPLAAEPEPEPEPLAAEPEHEPLAPEPEPYRELPAEVPSWLEPPRQRWRVVVAVLIVILVLAVVAAVVVALANV